MMKRLLAAVQLVASASAKYTIIVLLSLLAGLFIVNVQRFSGIQASPISGVSTVTKLRLPTDFDVFYLVAQMVWRGEIMQAYSFATMGPLQEALSGEKVFMPWTYPPQFNLIVAPLAFLPLGMAYTLFTAITLVAYLAMLRVVAGRHFTLLLFLLFPAITITMVCGQNGFLTGTLIGLACLGLQQRSAMAGLPLGLMIIKPHLAIGFAAYTLLSRNWGAALVAAATILATSALATLLLGLEIWTAFLGGVQEAAGYLKQGLYPFHRMVSPYAVLRTFGAPAAAGMVIQFVSAALSLLIVILAWRRGFSLRQTLGLTALASLLISPYAYDYDLPIYGIGLALLMPDILRLARPLEQALVFGLSFATGGFGLLLSQLKLTLTTEEMYLSVAGLTLAATLGLLWRILNRYHSEASLPVTFVTQEAG
ncbi:glycosyltransferase family 87 protein [Microvirga sp. G4-2]|uniref:glycosyltransferase family 87 protein n=1 Tax=Microvirga sp. G4-2 TaxID=3434467 RepID=UPI004043F730